MNTIRLGCGRAGTLFYEPDGLLLRSCLIPVDKRHSQHLLTFQLGYLGPGEIAVHVALEGGPVDGSGQATESTTALLRGTESFSDPGGMEAQRIPGVWLSYVSVPDAKVQYRYTIWGQPGVCDDDLRGELVAEVSGLVPLLTATTRASTTRQPIPDSVREQDIWDWDQEDGHGNVPPPLCARQAASARLGHAD
jgi:hypothetical protein